MKPLTTTVDTATQRLTATVPVYGTPHRLVYRSDSVHGSDPAATVTIPVGRDARPAGLRRVEVVVSVGEHRERRSLDPEELPVDVVVAPFRDGASARERRVDVAVGYVGDWSDEDPVEETMGRLERRLRGLGSRRAETDESGGERDGAVPTPSLHDDDSVRWATAGLTVYRLGPEPGFGNWSLEERAPSREAVRARHEAVDERGTTAEPSMPAAVEWDAIGGHRYEFDVDGHHRQTVDALADTATFAFEDDDDGLLAAVVDSDGGRTSVERDAARTVLALVAPGGARTELSVDDDDLVGVTLPGGETLSFEYATGSLLAVATDPAGRRTVVEYDDAGRVVARVRPGGEREEYVRTSTESGHEVRRVADPLAEEVVRIERLGSGGRTVTRRCCGDPALSARVDHSSRRVTFPDGSRLVVEEATDPEADDGAFAAALTYETPGGVETVVETDRSVERDEGGSIERVAETATVDGAPYRTVFHAAAGRLTTTTPAGRTRETTLDERGRRVETWLASLAPVRYGYDGGGRLSSVAMGDADGERRPFDFRYDADGALVGVTDPLGREYEFAVGATGAVRAEALPGDRTVEYEYDAAGECTAVAPPGRPAHRFEWSPAGRVSKYVPPPADASTVTAGGSEREVAGDGSRAHADATHEYEYDEEGRLVRTVTPDGQVVVTRDDAGRPVTFVLPDGRVTFTYDGAGALVSAARDETTVTYDRDGTLPRTATWRGAVDGRVTTTYGTGLRVTATQVNDEPALPVDRDEDGLVVGVGTLSLERDPGTGLLTGARLDATTDRWEHDPFADVRSHVVECGGDVVQSVRYERDALGRVTAVRTAFGDTAGRDATRVVEYDYDEAGRVASVRVDGDEVAAYEYDANGNRIRAETPEGEVTAEYDARDRLLRYGDATFAYTGRGVLRSRTDADGTTTYDYDLLGNLRAVELPDRRHVEYVVDGHNRRVAKRVDGSFVAGWLYDGDRPVAEVDADGAVRTRFVYGTHPHSPDYLVRDGRRYRVVTDQLGSPLAVVDSETGERLQVRRYDAFGVVERDSAPHAQPFGFAGGLYDPDTGLVRFGARDYDPSVGRFTAPDPLGFAGGDTNLYAYAAGDPVNVTDPTGRYWETALDIGSTVYDAANYAKCRSKENAFALVLDGISLLLPGVTGLSTVLRNVDDLVMFLAKNPGARGAVEEALDWAIREAGKHGGDAARAMEDFASALRRRLSQADDVVDAGRVADGTVDASKAADDVADAAGARPPRPDDGTAARPRRPQTETVPDADAPVSKTRDTRTVKTSVQGRVVPDQPATPRVNPDGTDRVVTVKTVSDAKPHSGKHLLKDKGIHTSKTRKKHLEGGKEAEKLYEKGDAKHVFRDDVDLDRTIDEVMDRGEYVGVDEHGYHRWVKRSDEPVGVRKKMGDEDQSLHYVEVKAKQNPDGTWSYHADPRGRPPESTKARKIDTTHPDPRFTSGQEANFGGE